MTTVAQESQITHYSLDSFSDRPLKTKYGTVKPRWAWSDWYRKGVAADINKRAGYLSGNSARAAYGRWLLANNRSMDDVDPRSIDLDYTAKVTVSVEGPDMEPPRKRPTVQYKALLRDLIDATKQDDVTALERAWNAANQALAA